MRAKGALKHNCIVHLSQFTAQNGPEQPFPTMPSPEYHAAPILDCRQAVVPWPAGESTPPVAEKQMQRSEPQVLFEDADNVVLLKPYGWLCTAAGVDVASAKLPAQERRKGVMDLQTQAGPAQVAQYLIMRYGESAPLCRDSACLFGLVFRLDLDTSGPVLAAKTKAGFEAARAQMRARDLVKDYVALVHGSMGAQNSGEMRGAIDDSTYEAKSVCRVSPKGKDAITLYETIGEYADASETYTLVHLRLITGRTHQARVHLAHAGHPIVNDARYAADAKATARDKAWCPRLFLHMVRLGFCTTKGMPVASNCPLQTMAPDLAQALGTLRPLKGGVDATMLAAVASSSPTVATIVPPASP